MKVYIIKCFIRNVVNSICRYIKKIFRSGTSIVKIILIIYLILTFIAMFRGVV